MTENIFMSYSRRELGFVDDLVSKLEGEKYNVWLDYRALIPGVSLECADRKRPERCRYGSAGCIQGGACIEICDLGMASFFGSETTRHSFDL